MDAGGAPNEPYYGASMFVDPMGQVMAHASETEEQIVYADLDPSIVRQARGKWTFYEDRRPELYGAIARRSGERE